MIIISIITPCFNGGDWLIRLYNHILSQPLVEHIEWVIVDDFSDDEYTHQVLLDLERNAKINLQVIYLDKNYFGSKSTYTGCLAAKGEYSIILDQDDILAPEGLEIFIKKIEEFRHLSNFAGVCGRCIDSKTNQIIGQIPTWDQLYTNELYIRHILKIRGEMFQCTKTSILIHYFESMKPGYTNGWAWAKIAKKYNYLYINQPVRVYNTQNSFSMSAHNKVKKIRYPESQFEQIKQYLLENYLYLKFDYKSKIILLCQMVRYGLKINLSFSDIKLTTPEYKYLFYIGYILGQLKNLDDIRKCK